MRLMSSLFVVFLCSFFITPAQAYTDITPADANEMLISGSATMIDVRTPQEWAWVGHPGANKPGEGAVIAPRVINVAWEVEKTDNGHELALNNNFIADIAKVKLDVNQPLIIMCRSGSRSVAAAKALEGAGYVKVYNVVDGFEGGTDTKGYRTKVAGWKNTGLPYTFGFSGNIYK